VNKRRKLEDDDSRETEWGNDECIDLTEDSNQPAVMEQRIRPRPPVSAPAPSSSKVQLPTSQKPRSSSGVPSSQHQESKDEEPKGYECPICGTNLAETDNDKINAHVDDCLNRLAIQEAQREDGDRGKSKSKNGWEWLLEGQRTSNSNKKRKKRS